MAARLGLKPWERDRMQAVEIAAMWDGYQWRLDQARRIAAVLASYVLSAWVKPPSVDEIETQMGKVSGS